jgi:predicted ATPase
MEPVIRSLTLENFRSVIAERVEFDNPTFLVGENASGKSNILDALAFLADAMKLPLRAVFGGRKGIYVVRNRSGPEALPPLGMRLDFGEINGEVCGGHYSFQLESGNAYDFGFEVVREQCSLTTNEGINYWFDRKGKAFTSSGGLSPEPDPASLVMPLVGGDLRFNPIFRILAAIDVYAISPANMKDPQDSNGGTNLLPDGSNVARVLKEINRVAPEDCLRMDEILARIVPRLTRFDTRDIDSKKSQLVLYQESRQGPLRFEAPEMSDGTLRALGIVAAVYQRPAPSVLVIEEPEASIHPAALGVILDVLRHASRQMQVIVTTHSSDLLDEKWIEDRHLRMVAWDNGETRVALVSKATRKVLKERLLHPGEALRSNALYYDPLPARNTFPIFEDRP